MTDQGGWGDWSPGQRPDERAQQEATSPEEAAPASETGSETTETPHTYGAPSYGAPSYGAPTYGAPAAYQQPTAPPAAPPSYGGEYGAPGGAGGSSPYGGYAQQQQQPPVDQQPTQQFSPYAYGGTGYGGTGYGGTGYGGTGYGGTPPPAGGQPPYGGYGTPTPPPPPPGKKKRSGGRIALILGIVVILVAGLGVGAWALFLRGGPAVTWQGKEVANPDQVLTEAQGDLDTLVSDVKGAKGGDTRCYYAVPKSPPKDTPKTDVGDTLYCGPALFVDGDTAKPFVPYGLSAGAAKDDKVTLTISSKGTDDGATSVPATQKLVRPDGASAPSGAGGLTVPEPPPADADVFTGVDDLDVPAAPKGATMGALTGGVTIVKLGEVKRYGTGSDARSAPDGQKLIAFQLDDAAGDGASDGASVLDLQVSVDGGGGEDIPDLSGINVIAVPTDAKSVDLVTSVNSVKQSLSLLTGKPGSGNLAVLSRANRIGSFTPPKTFNFTETGGGATADRPCTLSGSVAGLFYWVDDKGSAHASGAGNAILETDLKYTFSTDSPPPFTGSSAGDSATFEPSHLTLTLPGGATVPAKVISDHTIFEVPAGFTQGTITVGGAFTNTNAITFTVAAPVTFKVSIPAS